MQYSIRKHPAILIHLMINYFKLLRYNWKYRDLSAQMEYHPLPPISGIKNFENLKLEDSADKAQNLYRKTERQYLRQPL